ncbi:phosphate propanoyltransferase [Pontibacillus yanchengensis]|uniref:Phosphate propanoyltransferase n=2 Tax=Pontibacillus yanchengensis TaxID=462910 RepID=A0A6I5A5W3_9BACI|nr:phosphate propanoyltransferase [Pontibacillus yanchengensis]MYL35766.1 phosphate propanoyltransferase [Pontibacillus yanchengensis]MYL55477.1 phosphate propanoyltransferase [Pontibacillus yanchengensis]
MNKQDIQDVVYQVIERMQDSNQSSSEVPIGISARHCHLNKECLEELFGKGYELTSKAPLSQPGQFAANETVMIAGPRGSIEKVRILGPLRSVSQVEVSQTDAFQLGLKPPVRQSGHIEGSSPITIIGPKGSVYLDKGLIIAQAHIHMHPDDASYFNVKDKEVVAVGIDNGERKVTFEKTLIRVSEKYRLEMHIDTDEANSGAIKSGQYGHLKKVESTDV